MRSLPAVICGAVSCVGEERFGGAVRSKVYFDSAIADCTQAIRLDPKHAEAYHYRGLAYQKKGDRAKAESDFAKAKELGY